MYVHFQISTPTLGFKTSVRDAPFSTRAKNSRGLRELMDEFGFEDDPEDRERADSSVPLSRKVWLFADQTIGIGVENGR